MEFVEKHYLKRESIFTELLKTTFEDSFDRLIMPSLDTELRNELTDRANEQAIKMFKVNLKPLLMQPPLKHKRILGFDPGYRTGCKLAVIDENGKVLDKGVVFATPPQSKIEESEKIILNLIDKYKIDCISIGKLPLGALEEIKLGVELCATDYVAREIKIRIDLTKSLREAQNEISSSKLKDMLIDLADNLPEQTPNFYNSLGMEKLHSKIDNITDYIIYHSPETLSYKQDFDDIVKEKDDMIKNYCYRNDYKLPTESVGEKMMRDLYRRLGNIIIQKAKEIKFADIQRMKLDARYRYQKQMEKNKRKQLFNECLYLSMKCNYEAIKAFQDYMRKLEEIHIKRLMEEGVLDAEDFHFEM